VKQLQLINYLLIINYLLLLIFINYLLVTAAGFLVSRFCTLFHNVLLIYY